MLKSYKYVESVFRLYTRWFLFFCCDDRKIKPYRFLNIGFSAIKNCLDWKVLITVLVWDILHLGTKITYKLVHRMDIFIVDKSYLTS